MVRLLVLALLAFAQVSRADEALPLAAAIEQKQIVLKGTGNGRDTLHLQFSAPAKVSVLIPAGAQFRAESGETQIALRSVTVALGPNAEVDAIIPAAAFSSANSATQRAVAYAGPEDSRLSKLLALFGHQDDLPRPTAQLAIFVALEDLTWPAWKKWLEPVWSVEKPAKSHPTPAEVAQAVDAIAFARLASPEGKFAILADDDLKRLALRNPWARGKAMVLYGMSVEDAITGDPSLPVDLGKLLHTSPNDNCPICRQRAKSPVEIP